MNTTIELKLKGLLAIMLCCLSCAKGESHRLELPLCLGSHMVLQREVPLKFWGWGTPGDSVIVEFTRQDVTIKDTVEIDKEGRWLIQLPAQPVCIEPCQLTFSLKDYPETLKTLTDILIGDVWFAGGQSNMEKKVNHLLETEQYVQEANSYPLIRSFRTAYNIQNNPAEKVSGSSVPWFVCNSDKVADNVSAVAYVYARELYDNLQIPIGIIQAYRGGTEIETWISPDKLSQPEYCKIIGRNDFNTPGSYTTSHSVHYNGQINPLINYAIKGFIFYQGESNTKRALEYRYMMRMLIEDWRSQWGMGDLPFYYIQMFNVLAPSVYEEANWPDLREQQAKLLYDKSIANIGMAVIIDTNEEATNKDDMVRMHPRNKKPVGERLSKIALKNTYGMDIVAESPSLSRYEFTSEGVSVYFKNYAGGLKIGREETTLNGFVLSGDDKKFKSATATIVNDSTVLVKSDLVTNPVAVRYAWARNPICNLYNSADLPAIPFKTDMWNLFSYASFQSSCTDKSNDADLITIRVNGVPLPDFDAKKFNYTVKVNSAERYPDVTAISNNPFATLLIEEKKEDKKIIVTSAAEDGTKQIYEILIEPTTELKEKNIQNPISIYQENKTMVIKNESDIEYDLSIFNTAGECFIKEALKDNSQNKYEMFSGIYLVQLNANEKQMNFKFIIRHND